MRFGAMNFPVICVIDEINAIGELGMDYVEIAMDPPRAHYTQLQAQQSAIRRALTSHNLGLVCHLPTFVFTADLADSIRKASVQEVIGSLETADSLGAEKVVLHPGWIGGLAIHVMDQALELAMDSLNKISRSASALGLTVCVENMFPRFGPFVEIRTLEPVFYAFPEFKFVLDVAHAHIGDKYGRRAQNLIERFSSRLAHVHISDNMGINDDHLPVGAGTVRFKPIIKALCQAGYKDTFTLEIFVEKRKLLIKSRNKLLALIEENK
ncbi:MAG: sugar phosphate isomerase/epimerase [Desulfobacteraceae bacterium]|nr:sugar phosphate isomerase/epimerase [Desulfobacteraceae bacterium]